jgi:hypothetical protein
MTLYIVTEDKPGIVTRYDNVIEIIADRESQTIYIEQVVWGRHKPNSIERYKNFECRNLTNVKSIESN